MTIFQFKAVITLLVFDKYCLVGNCTALKFLFKLETLWFRLSHYLYVSSYFLALLPAQTAYNTEIKLEYTVNQFKSWTVTAIHVEVQYLGS